MVKNKIFSSVFRNCREYIMLIERHRFYAVEVLAILKGGRRKFPLLKRGGRERFYPVLRGGEGHKKFRTCNFSIL